MCVQVTKTANRFEISSLLEKILLKQVRWCLNFVGLYILINTSSATWTFQHLCLRVLSFIFYWFGMVRRRLTIPDNGGFSHRRVADHFRARIPLWRRRLITVHVLMWPPKAKLPRSAPAVLNGRCRARLDMSRSSLGVALRGLPARGRSVTFPVWRNRSSVDITSLSCSSWLVTWSFGVDYSHMEMGPLVWWKSFFATPYWRSCKGLAPTTIMRWLTGQCWCTNILTFWIALVNFSANKVPYMLYRVHVWRHRRPWNCLNSLLL
jgi:hypothetical protein